MAQSLVFTDASRCGDGSGATTAWAWVAVESRSKKRFIKSRAARMTTNNHSTVHAEAEAVFSVFEAFESYDGEVHIFTDSKFVIDQWKRESRGIPRRSKIYYEDFVKLAEDKRFTLHYVPAHKSYFYNEVVDKMSRFVAFDELSTNEAETWGEKTCRRGVLEIHLSNDMSYKPKRVNLTNPKNEILHSLARG